MTIDEKLKNYLISKGLELSSLVRIDIYEDRVGRMWAEFNNLSGYLLCEFQVELRDDPLYDYVNTLENVLKEIRKRKLYIFWY